MILASLPATYIGAFLGAGLTAYNTKSSKKAGVSSLCLGGTLGAAAPTVIKVAHTAINKLFESIANIELLKISAASLSKYSFTLVGSNPTAIAAIIITLAVLLVLIGGAKLWSHSTRVS